METIYHSQEEEQKPTCVLKKHKFETQLPKLFNTWHSNWEGRSITIHWFMYKKYLATQESEAISLSLGKAKENSSPCMIGYLDPKNRDFINYILFIVNVLIFRYLQKSSRLPRWHSGKESACQCRRHGFDHWVRRSPGEGNGKPLQYSCHPMDRWAWRATLHGVAKRQNRLSDWASIFIYRGSLSSREAMTSLSTSETCSSNVYIWRLFPPW